MSTLPAPPGPVWVDGRLVAADAATVGALDHGVTVGDGLFETIRVLEGRPVFWPRHLARLRRGLAVLGLELGRTDDDLLSAARAVLAHQPGDARLRLTVTSGPGALGPARGGGPATVVVAAAPLPPVPPSLRLVTATWVRNERSPLAGVKSTSYGEGVLQLAEARRRGADELLLCDTRGRVSEAVTANVVVGVGGVLLTPSLTAGCLPGTIREVLLEVGVVAEADLPASVLTTADEVALTSSTRGIVAVEQLDDRRLGPLPGPLTRQAAAALAEAVADDLRGAPPSR
jgi:branched-chain amino acid aminotransferase